jgi:polyisoprenoid-binding protein YceI
MRALVRILMIALCAAAVPGLALAAQWKMRPAESSILVKGSLEGAAFTGAFKTFTADIDFDPKDLAHSKVVVTVDMSSFATGNPLIDDPGQGATSKDWFAVSQFPKAVFATKSFRDLGGGKYEAVGDLTIRGIGREVVLPFTLAIAGDTATVTGTLGVTRTDWGVGQPPWDKSDEVGRKAEVEVKLVADKAG